MINDAKITKLSDLNNGQAEDEFRQALVAVIENMQDQKCDGRATRRINIAVSFHPDPKQSAVSIEIETTTKLAKRANRRMITMMTKGTDGQIGLFTDDPAQAKMFNDLTRDLMVSSTSQPEVK